MKYKGYVGTYTTSLSEGIYSFDYENQKIENVSLFAECKNPKYLTFAEDMIAAACEIEQGAGIRLFDLTGKEISHLVYEKIASCFITYRGGYLYTANYHEGTFSVIAIENNKELKLVKKFLFKEKAGTHQVLFYQDKFLIPCLFLDQIFIMNQNYEIENSIVLEPGAGPRHGVLSDDNAYLYIIGELSNLLYVIDMKTLAVVNQVHLLENNLDHVKDSAAIRKLGEYLYISTRTQDVISVVKAHGKNVELMQVTSCMGKHPRDFEIIDQNLLVVNRLTNNISLLNLENHLVGEHIQTESLPEGIAIIYKEVL